MRMKATGLGRKIQQLLMLGFGLFPAAVLLTMMICPAALSRLPVAPTVYALLALGCLMLPGRIRLISGVLAAGGLIGIAWLLLPLAEVPALWLIPAGYGILLLWSLQMNVKQQEMPAAVGILGVIFYVLTQVCLIPAQHRDEAHMGIVTLWLTLGFLIFATAAVLTFNRASMEAASQQRGETPQSMRRTNKALTLLLLGIGVVLAAVPAIGKVLAIAWQWLMQGLVRLAAFLMSLFPEETAATGGAPMGMGDLGLMIGEVTEPSAFSKLMEKVLAGLAIAVTAAAFVWLGIKLSRLLWRLAKRLWQRLNRMAAAIGEDYEDEITDTREEGERSQTRFALEKLLDWRDERHMTPSQRVRYRYKRQRIKKDWRGASTARENLPEEAAEIYERVRYGGAEVTPEEAEQFAKRLEDT